MQQSISIDPFKCRIWNMHDRIEDGISEESCKAEIQSFTAHGQLIPALGRRLHGDPDFDIELIYGARRLFVARHLKKPLIVEVRVLTDREAVIAMDAENRLRKDISPYERGLGYKRLLQLGQFESQEDIAHALRVSKSQVSRLLRLARLPAVIMDAFRSTTDICENWGLQLMDALEDPDRRSITIQAARSLCKNYPRLSGAEVHRHLLVTPELARQTGLGTHDRVVLAANGSPLFRIRQQSRSIALIVPTENISAKSLEQIESAVAAILQESARGVVRNTKRATHRAAIATACYPNTVAA